MEYIQEILMFLEKLFSNKILVSIFIYIPFVLGLIIGVFNWEKNEDFYYLDLYKDILESEKLRYFSKILIIVIISIPYTISFITYFLVSFKFIPYILFKDRRFL